LVSFGGALAGALVVPPEFDIGFSKSAFNEKVSRLSRPRFDGALKPTFSKTGERSRSGINVEAFSAFP
jgi:hypothetical protein